MCYFIFKVFVIVVSIEALTELVVKSEFFSPIRNFFSGKKNRVCKFIDNILRCPYCFSVWAAIIIISISYNDYGLFVLYILLTHRLSNVCHNIFDKLFY